MASDEVGSLVASVRDHLRFKQLAVYSIETFTKVLGPPNPKWRDHVERALEIDAAKVVINCLRAHPGDEAVLAAATRCLSRLAVDATNAKIIAREGGVDAVLESIGKVSANNKDGFDAGPALALLETMTDHRFEVTADMLAILATFDGCERILEKVTRSQRGVDAAVKADVARKLLPLRFANKNNVLDSLKVFHRLVVNDQETKLFLRQYVDTFVAVAAKFSEDDDDSDSEPLLLRVVARLVYALLDSDVAALLKKLPQNDDLATVLATLAADVGDEIAASGGVRAIVRALEGKASQRAREDLVRTITRLATSAKGLDDILKNHPTILTQLVDELKKEESSGFTDESSSSSSSTSPSAIAALVLKAMNEICAAARTLPKEFVPALDTVLAALTERKSGGPLVAERALEFLLHGLKSGSIPSVAAAPKKMVSAVAAAMKAYPSSDGVQLAACRVLRHLATATTTTTTTAAEKRTALLSCLEEEGILDVLLLDLDVATHSADVVKAALRVLGDDENVLDDVNVNVNVKEEDAVFDAIVKAVCKYPEDVDLRRAAVPLVAKASSDFVERRLRRVAANFESRRSLETSATTLGVLAMVPENGPRLAGAAPKLVSVLDGLASTTKESSALVATVTRAVLDVTDGVVATASPDAFFPLLEDASKAAVAVARSRAGAPGVVAPALAILERAAAFYVEEEDDDRVFTLVDLGVVEAASTAIVKNSDDLRVLEPASTMLAAVCTADLEGLAERDGGGACLRAIEAMTAVVVAKKRRRSLTPLAKRNNDTGERGMVAALQVVEKVGEVHLFSANSKKRAVDAVVEATNTFQGCSSSPKRVVEQCERTMRVLTGADGTIALKVLDELKEMLPLPDVEEGDPLVIRKATGVVTKLGVLAACESFAAPIRQNGGPEALSRVLGAATTTTTSKAKKKKKQKGSIEASRANLVRASLRALGRVGVLSKTLIPALIRELEDNPDVDVVEAITRFAERDPDSTARALVDAGVVEALIPLLFEVDSLREPVARCLAALAKTSDAARKKLLFDNKGKNNNKAVVPFLCSYVAERNDVDVDDGGREAAMCLLSALVVEEGDYCVEALMEAGILKMIGRVLDRATTTTTKRGEISAVAELTKKLVAVGPTSTAKRVTLATSRKVATLIEALATTTTGQEGGLGDLAELVEVLAIDDAAVVLEQAGVRDALVKAMTSSPNDLRLASRCASALGKLGGGVQDLRPLLLELRRRGQDGDVAGVADTAQLAANVVLQPGALKDQAAADDGVVIIRDVLARLEPGDHASRAAANNLRLLSRIVDVDAVDLPDLDLVFDCLRTTGAYSSSFSSSSSGHRATPKKGFVVVVDDAIKAAACASLASTCRRGGLAAVRKVFVGEGGLLLQEVAADAASHFFRRRNNNSNNSNNADCEEELQREASEALELVALHAVPNASILAADADGAAVLAIVLRAFPALAKDVAPQALLEALTQMNYAGKFDGFRDAASAVIGQVVISCDAVVPWRIEHVGALCAGKKHLQEAEGVLAAFLQTLETKEGAALCFGNYDPDFNVLVGVDLGSDVVARAFTAANLLSKAIAFGDATANAGILASGLPRAMVDALKVRLNEEGFVQNDLYGLNALADACGVDKMNLLQGTAATIRIVVAAMKAHPDSEYVKATGTAFLEKLKAAAAAVTTETTEPPSEELLRRLKDLPTFHRASVDWQKIASAGSAPYYFNATTGESLWEQPLDHLSFVDELTDITKLVDEVRRQGDLSSVLDDDPAAAAELAGILKTHARDAGVCGRVARVLNTFGKTANFDGLALSENDLIEPLDHCGSTSDDFVDDATELLSHLREERERKKTNMSLLSLREYVRVLNQTCLDHMSTANVVRRCLAILANLAFNNAENIGYEFQVNVPYTVKWALRQHVRDAELCDIAVYAASCLLTDDEPRKKYVCEQLATEIVAAAVEALLLPEEGAAAPFQETLFTKATRCFGAFSMIEDCIVVMVKAEVVPLVVRGIIDANLGGKKKKKPLKYAVDLLSNFGSSHAAADALFDAGAIPAIRRVLDEHTSMADEDAQLMAACFDALYNFVGGGGGNEGHHTRGATKLMTDEGLCEKTVDCLWTFFDQDVRRQCAKLLTVLTYDQYSVDRLTRLQTTAILVGALKMAPGGGGDGDGDGDADFVVDCLLSLSNLVISDHGAFFFLEDDGALEVLFTFLNDDDQAADVVKLVIIALVRMTRDDRLSSKIAEDGMPAIMRTTARFLNNDDEGDETVSLIFELLGQLAFLPTNLRALVGAGGVSVLLDSLQKTALVVKALTTIDSLVSADLEYATLVSEKSGERLIREAMMRAHKHPKAKDAGEAALLSLRAMFAQKERQRTNRAALFARLGEEHMDAGKLTTQTLKAGEVEDEPLEDPVKKFRDLLTNGSVLKVWDKGKAATRKVAVNADWSSLLLRETAAKNAAIQGRVPFRHVKRAQLGFGQGHLVKSILASKPKPTAKEDYCFVLKGHNNGDDLLCGECASKQDAAKIVDAIQRTLTVFTQWPHRLANG